MSEHAEAIGEARRVIEDVAATIVQKAASGRSSMPITLDDASALVALAALGLDAAQALTGPNRCSCGHDKGWSTPPQVSERDGGRADG